jgi:hypothetical protein
VPGDERETSVTDDDLAIVSAKQKLATLKDRADYLDALRMDKGSGVARAVVLAASASCGGIMYACKLYVTAAWLMWFLIVLFGILGALFLLAAIGFSPKLAGQKWAVAIVDKQMVGDKPQIRFLRDTGERYTITVTDQMYKLLRPGDLGVLHTTGSDPNYTFDSFQRL